MRIYLDNCCLQRPLDDESRLCVRLESEAILAVLGLCERGMVSIVSSEVLELELDQNPDPQRKAFVEEIIAQTASFVAVDDQITKRAKELEYDLPDTVKDVLLSLDPPLWVYLGDFSSMPSEDR